MSMRSWLRLTTSSEPVSSSDPPVGEPYSLLADYYNRGWSEYSTYVAELIGQLERESRRRFGRVLDCACGTGLLLGELDDGTRHLVGFDRSETMLAKARAAFPQLTWLHGELAGAFPTDERFDLVVSVFDSLNYLLEVSQLQTFFRSAVAALDERGALVCDLNSELMYHGLDGARRLRTIGGVAIVEEVAVVSSDPLLASTRFTIDGRREEHLQRAWDSGTVERCMNEAGLRLVDTLDVIDAGDGYPSGKVVYIASTM